MDEIVNGSERREVALPNHCLSSLFPQSANIPKAKA